jgi:glycosyltransferase involved in cell wall biosynthesis
MHIAAAFEDSNGYGAFTNNIIRHAIRSNIEVRLTPLFGMLPPADLMPYVIPASRRPDVQDVIFCSVSNTPTDIEGKILFTMTETTEVPWEHGAGLKRFPNIIVPSKYSAEAVAKWNQNVHLCPLGADMAWSPINFNPFTFTVVATDHLVPARKRVQEIVDVFSATFKTEGDVRLFLKRGQDCRRDITFDNRVQAVYSRMPRAEFDRVMHNTTVGVQVSAAEGWSLPVNEFMAMGRPIIMPLAGAMGDYASPEVVFPVDYTMVQAPKPIYLATGKVPHADIEDVGRQMRYAYENRFEVARKGIRAREHAAGFTTHIMGERFIELCQTMLT